MYTIAELSSLTGLKPRTIHYYREIGLLTGPSGPRKIARWPDSDLKLLQRIKDEVIDSRVTLANFRERLDYEAAT